MPPLSHTHKVNNSCERESTPFFSWISSRIKRVLPWPIPILPPSFAETHSVVLWNHGNKPTDRGEKKNLLGGNIPLITQQYIRDKVFLASKACVWMEANSWVQVVSVSCDHSLRVLKYTSHYITCCCQLELELKHRHVVQVTSCVFVLVAGG